jgi:hypothetical protein
MAPEPHIVVLLGAGSTVGARCEPAPPEDRNFFQNACVQNLLRSERYPALNWGKERFAPCSLEDLVTQTDLLAKLCASIILSEEKDYWKRLDQLRARGNKDRSYAWRLAIEEPCMALPALVAPEAWSILCGVLGPLNPPTTSPLATLLKVLLHSI